MPWPRQYGPVLLSGLVASGGLLVDQGMAATLPSGSVSTLVYANRFVSVVLNLLAGAIATAVTPYFSQMVARSDWAGCRHTINTYVRITALVSVPVALVMIFGSHMLVGLTFQHGAFGAQDTAAVAPVQAMYAIQLPFYIVSRVYYRYLLAIRRSSLILYCGMINLVLDVVLNLIFMRWYGVSWLCWPHFLCGPSAFIVSSASGPTGFSRLLGAPILMKPGGRPPIGPGAVPAAVRRPLPDDGPGQMHLGTNLRRLIAQVLGSGRFRQWVLNNHLRCPG